MRVNAHPPPAVLLALPLGRLDYRSAVLAWNLLSFVALAVSLWLVAWQLRVPFTVWSLLPTLTLLILCSPLRSQIVLGQWNLVLLLLITAAWAADRSGHPVWAGVLVGAAAAVKLFPGFLLLYFLLQGRWRALAAGVGCFLVITLTTAGVLGLDTYQVYATQVVPAVDASHRGTWANVSLPGFWSKLFDPGHGSANLVALRDSPALARAAGLVSCAVVTGLLAWLVYRARSQPQRDRAFGLAVITMVLVSPISWDHYLLLLLVPLADLWMSLPLGGAARWLFRLILVIFWVPSVLIWRIFIPGVWTDNWLYLPAHPWQTLTALSVQTYALVALFGLSLAGARARPHTDDNTLSDKGNGGPHSGGQAGLLPEDSPGR
jgi:hypothetical protein